MFHPFPPIPKDLIEALEERYPERSPEPPPKIIPWEHPRDHYADMMVRAGEAKVIRFLRHTFDEQNETVLAMQDPNVLRP